ncbi:spore-associated protein [Nonomuraea dietziae]|uniref:Spore-associated protein A n=1 Tax=Nonomuraea dietziae TaxID=65515 RepID=A0A7W5V1H3_9ACTN|nr:spore-associated protein [Nonomuraea dietziae]MBB3727049.1 hypothetical protein [Nonomuraea dietziae]
MIKSVLAATLALGGILVAPAAANAAGYTPEGICGKGFAVVNRAPVGSWGTVYLLYNRRNGLNCAVTIKSKHTGVSTRTSVLLEVARPFSNNTPPYIERASDDKRYKFYAGPVKLQGKGMCVRFSGAIANRPTKAQFARGGNGRFTNCG